MKLRFFLKDNKKVYTLKDKGPYSAQTKDAHYKFIKIRPSPKDNP